MPAPLLTGERSPLRALLAALGGGLRSGEVGLIGGRAGVGKSSLLIHLALSRLLREESVLHIALRYRPQHVRDQYDSLLEGVLRPLKPLERAEILLQIERGRIIHTRPGSLGVADIKKLLDTLLEVMEFSPSLLLIDGWEPEDVPALQSMLRARGICCFCTCSPQEGGPLFQGGEEADVQLEILPDRQSLRLHPHRIREQRDLPPIRLDGVLHLAVPDSAPTDRPRPEECTLYSGGAAGAEAAFGELAESWRIKEVNFTFDGHVQARSRGATPLTASELARGDVSLAYVARRLRRGFGEGSIRRVLQSLWHQISHAEQVFVIGTIQEDGTVTGGTGWGVELARMWNKRLWVYDQEKEAWFRWNGEDWVAGIPAIDARAWCGTGSRVLTPHAQQAMESLMERSFGGQPG